MNPISVTGLYFSYNGAEYEDAFVGCGSKEIWKMGKNEIHRELDELYGSMNLSRHGEMVISARGHYTPIDRTRYPNSHYSGTFTLERVDAHSTDRATIEACRNDERFSGL